MSLKHILGGAAAALILALASVPALTVAADAPAPAAAPAADAAPAAMTATSPAPTTETIDNPYGLEALWKGGDFVAHGTLLALLIMSAGTWYIMVTKLIEQSKVIKHANEAREKFWVAATIAEGTAALEEASPFRYIAETGLSANEHHEGKLLETIDRHSWVTMSIQRAVDLVGGRMQTGLTFLATVGSTAPFVGLFGTVWGIYHALTAIGIAGQASIDKVAGPVGEALIMTAIGLAVAVPAVLGYNWLVNRNKTAMAQVRTFGADLHSTLIAGARVGNRG
jgi:biopolymer transport protein ExbB